MIGSFFEGPLMAAYGAQFGGAAPGAGFGGAANLPLSFYVACHPTLTCTHYQCHSLQIPCVTQVCTRTVVECTRLCPAGPAAGQAAAMAAPAAAAQFLPSLVCSYAPHCWFSYGACPTMFGCGPFHTPGCPQVQAQAPMAAAGPQPGAGAVAGSYAPHCWYSWNACPTMFGCGPHHTPGCPQFQAQAQDPAAAGAGEIAITYAPHCWYSWNACPTMFGCGPHHTPGCPQFQAQAQDPAAAAAAPGGAAGIAGSYAPHCWYSWNACPTMFGCGPHHTPGCPQFQAQAQDPAAAAAAQGGGAAIAGSYAPHCWYSWNACPTMFGCGPHHTPGCPQFQAQAQDPAAAAAAQGGPAAIVGSYAPHCWYSWNACPTMFGCGPHHTPGCPQFR